MHKPLPQVGTRRRLWAESPTARRRTTDPLSTCWLAGAAAETGCHGVGKSGTSLGGGAGQSDASTGLQFAKRALHCVVTRANVRRRVKTVCTVLLRGALP